MNIDRHVNAVLSFLFGKMPDGDRKVWFHSQNLNEDRNGEPKGWPYHGRWWLHLGHKHEIHFSWNLWSHFCGIGIGTDSEDRALKLHIAFPPVSFWLTLSVPQLIRKTKPFNTFEFEFAELRVFDYALWWKFWHGEDWNRKRASKFRDGNFHPIDFFLGHMKCKTEVLETKDVQIPMPEGLYAAKAKMEERTRSRARWFGKKSTSIWIDIPGGIPHQGKGENSWDCGEDALCGCGVEGTSYEKAIAHVVESVLKYRRKYDGNMMAKYPDPSTRPPPQVSFEQGEASA